MTVQNLNKFKGKKAVLTSLAFLMLSSSQLNASNIIDESNIVKEHYTTSYQVRGKNEEAYQENSIKPQYNLVGVALFSGRDPFSWIIKAVSQSKVSHVGLILADAADENKWYCFEITGSAKEVLKGKAPHVHYPVLWEKEVKDYSGKVSYRLFVFDDKDRPNTNVVTQFVEKYENVKYTKIHKLTRLAKALFKKNKQPKSEELERVFCSELTAHALIKFGILESLIPANFTPKDFTSKKTIPLVEGVSLTPEFKAKKSDFKRYQEK